MNTLWALTLIQPWATYIAQGVKKQETRDWPPPRSLVGKRLAIHAGKDTTYTDKGPFGVIVCTAVLTGAFRVRDLVRAPKDVGRAAVGDAVPLKEAVTGEIPEDLMVDEYGDWSPGRWIWCLDDVHVLPQPVAVRGRQKVWFIPPDAATLLAVQDKGGGP